MNFRRLLPLIALVTIACAIPTAQAGYRYYSPYRHYHHSYSNVSIGFGFSAYPYWGYGYGYGWPYRYSGYYPYGYGYSYYPAGYSSYPYSYGYYSRPIYRGQSVSTNVVVRVQERLARAGHYHGAIDGVVGPETRRAIRAYERAHGLRIDGGIN